MKQLPVFNIDGVNFYVDKKLQQFREVNNSHNFFSFENLKDEGEYYALKWNSDTNTPFEGWWEHGKESENLKDIIVPTFILEH